MTRTIESAAALITVLLTTSLFGSPAPQPAKSRRRHQTVSGFIEFCTQHITATPGHIIWTG
jgi:hypothetical protein